MIEKTVATKYWKELINTKIHTLNQVQLNKGTYQTPYELWCGYKPNVYHFKLFGKKGYILKEARKEKFEAKSDKGVFLGYSNKSEAYKCMNHATNIVIESQHVKIDEFVEQPKLQIEELESQTKELESQTKETEHHRIFKHGEPSEPSFESRRKEPALAKYVRRHHAPDKIIGDQAYGILTRRKLKGTCFLSELNLDL